MNLSSVLQITWGIKDLVGYKSNQPRGAVKIPLISRGAEQLTVKDNPLLTIFPR